MRGHEKIDAATYIAKAKMKTRFAFVTRSRAHHRISSDNEACSPPAVVAAFIGDGGGGDDGDDGDESWRVGYSRCVAASSRLIAPSTSRLCRQQRRGPSGYARRCDCRRARERR